MWDEVTWEAELCLLRPVATKDSDRPISLTDLSSLNLRTYSVFTAFRKLSHDLCAKLSPGNVSHSLGYHGVLFHLAQAPEKWIAQVFWPSVHMFRKDAIFSRFRRRNAIFSDRMTGVNSNGVLDSSVYQHVPHDGTVSL